MAWAPKEELIKMKKSHSLMVSNVFTMGTEVQINESCINSFALHN